MVDRVTYLRLLRLPNFVLDSVDQMRDSTRVFTRPKCQMVDIRGHKVVTLSIARTATRGIFTTIQPCTRRCLRPGIKFARSDALSFTRSKYRVVKFLQSFTTYDLANWLIVSSYTFAKSFVFTFVPNNCYKTRLKRPVCVIRCDHGQR